MASDAEMIGQIKSQTLSLIADLTAQPKPSYAVDGQQVSWADYLRRLQQTVDWCDQQLAAAEPFEFQTEGGSS